jgi:hypothetical protein
MICSDSRPEIFASHDAGSAWCPLGSWPGTRCGRRSRGRKVDASASNRHLGVFRSCPRARVRSRSHLAPMSRALAHLFTERCPRRSRRRATPRGILLGLKPARSGRGVGRRGRGQHRRNASGEWPKASITCLCHQRGCLLVEELEVGRLARLSWSCLTGWGGERRSSRCFSRRMLPGQDSGRPPAPGPPEERLGAFNWHRSAKV